MPSPPVIMDSKKETTLAKEFAKKHSYKALLSLITEADKRNITTTLISSEEGLVKFSKNNTSIISLKHSLPFLQENPSIANIKNATKAVLKDCDILTPKGIRAQSFSGAITKINKEQLKYPLIVKPAKGSLAKGVSWNILDQRHLEKSIVYCQKNMPKETDFFLVEEMIIGDEFRVLVLDGAVIAVAKKIPASVIGDGKKSISQLIEQFNETRSPGFFIEIDKEIITTLSQKCLSLHSIIPLNKTIRLRNTLLMRNGGRSINVIDTFPGELKQICIEAAKAIGLTYTGIDVIAKINTTHIDKTELIDYAILELNNQPIHIINEAPLCENTTINISEKLLSFFFGDN